jgi:hypothetical protein
MDVSFFLQNKIQREHPSWYISPEQVKQFSTIHHPGLTPYPFYFQSNPFDSFPTIDEKEAGWSSRIVKPPRLLPRPFYPDHKFQSACNTIYTEDKNGKQPCVNMYR